MKSVNFSETVLARALFVGFFALMGALISVAMFIKIGENLLWVIPALLATALTLLMFYFIWYSYRTRQTITINPQGISVSSPQHGTTVLRWPEIEQVYQVQNKADEVRENFPGLEILLTYYIMLPSTSSGEKRGLLIIKAADGRKITLRQHLLYDYRLDQVLQAVQLYAPGVDSSLRLLRTNTHN